MCSKTGRALYLCLLLIRATPIPAALFESGFLPGPAAGDAARPLLYPAALIGKDAITLAARLVTHHGVNELTRIDSSIRICKQRWGVAARYATFGWEAWRENSVGIAFGWSPFEGVSTGAAVRLLWLQGWGLPLRATLAIDLDCRIRISKNLLFRTTLRNLNEPRFFQTDASSVSLEMEAGIEWQPLPWFTPGISFLSGDEERDAYPILHLGIGSGALQFRVSADLSPLTVSLNCILKIGHISTGAGLVYTCGIPDMGRESSVAIKLGGKARGVQAIPPIDVNRAPLPALLKLPGIKPGVARKIIRFRTLHGPFRRLRDLCRIRGIGSAQLVLWEGRAALDENGSRSLKVVEGCPGGFDLNIAEIREFAAVGINPESARRIILFREKIGGFQTIKELRLLPGLSKKTRLQLRALYANN